MGAKQPNEIAEAVRDLREIYRAAKKAGDFRAMLRARKELNALLGLYDQTPQQEPALASLKLKKVTP